MPENTILLLCVCQCRPVIAAPRLHLQGSWRSRRTIGGKVISLWFYILNALLVHIVEYIEKSAVEL